MSKMKTYKIGEMRLDSVELKCVGRVILSMVVFGFRWGG